MMNLVRFTHNLINGILGLSVFYPIIKKGQPFIWECHDWHERFETLLFGIGRHAL